MKRTFRGIPVIQIECITRKRYTQGLSNVAIHIRQPRAVIERLATDRSHRVRNSDAGQTAAARERLYTDRSHRVGDIDAGQAAAAIERIPTDARDGFGDYKICSFLTINKQMLSIIQWI